MPGFVLDRVPSALIRAFSEDWHRHAFMAGSIRLKHIAQFRKSTDAREDTGEGRSYIRVPGQVPVVHIARATMETVGVDHVPGFVHRQSEFLNPTYLHCASAPDVDRTRLTQNFGGFLAEIRAPEVFFRRVFDASVASGMPDRTVDFFHAFPIQYTKGDIQPEPANFSDSLRLDYGQKPAAYQWESEYRAVLAFSGPLHSYPDCLELELGDLSDIVRKI